MQASKALLSKELSYSDAKKVLEAINVRLQFGNVVVKQDSYPWYFGFKNNRDYLRFNYRLKDYVDSFTNPSGLVDIVDVASKLMQESEGNIEFATHKDFQYFSARVFDIYEIITAMVERDLPFNIDQLTKFKALLVPFLILKKS